MKTEKTKIDIKVLQPVLDVSSLFIKQFLEGNRILLAIKGISLVRQCKEIEATGLRARIKTISSLKYAGVGSKVISTLLLSVLASYWKKSILEIALLGAENLDKRAEEGTL